MHMHLFHTPKGDGSINMHHVERFIPVSRHQQTRLSLGVWQRGASREQRACLSSPSSRVGGRGGGQHCRPGDNTVRISAGAFLSGVSAVFPAGLLRFPPAAQKYACNVAAGMSVHGLKAGDGCYF